MNSNPHEHGHWESYSGVVCAKRSNEGQGGPQEIVEGRPLTKENAGEPSPYRTPTRENGPSGLDRVRRAAKENPKMRFTALLHQVNIEQLRSSYYAPKRKAAAGLDGATWQAYGNGLEERLADLHGRILNQIWEEDFQGFWYGFRPGCSQHDVLDALSVAIVSKRVNYILDFGIRGTRHSPLAAEPH